MDHNSILNEIEKKYIKFQALSEDYNLKLSEYDNRISRMNEQMEVYDKSKDVLSEISKEVREKAINLLENTVTTMFNTILKTDRYKFKIVNVALSRNKPSVEFYLVSDVDGNESIEEPTSGGLIDIISTALRYAFLSIYDGGLNNAIILDEPARMVDTTNAEDYGSFLSYLSTVFNRQTIVCTHNPLIINKADKVISVEKPSDYSIVN